MGRKCGVEGCLSDSNRAEDTGVTFHKVPMHNDIRPKWLSLCRIPDDKKTQKVIYICSRHFLRMDFCSFKGRKYMLRQGVLPSVFPWDKSKLEAIKGTTNIKQSDGSESPKTIKTEKSEAASDSSQESQDAPEPEPPIIKQEVVEEQEEEIVTDIKQEIKDEIVEVVNNDIKEEVKPDIKVAKPIKRAARTKATPREEPNPTKSGNINFGIDSSIEVLDNDNQWCPAKIVEEDDEENEVLIRFENNPNKHDEWICKDSPRLRPFQEHSVGDPGSAGSSGTQFAVGERCLASWCNSKMFPASITKVLPDDAYEVLFDDGFVKILKGHRLCKFDGRPMQSSPLFDPVQGTKQERREKKRKINIAQLFGKRPRVDAAAFEEKPTGRQSHIHTESPADSSDVIYEPWVPLWENGIPVGVESCIESYDGQRKSIVVPDPRLPKGWQKHLVQRVYGASAGKWDTVLVSPDNRRFRSRTEVKAYLEDNKLMKFNWTMFDFSLYSRRGKKKKEAETPAEPPQVIEPPIETAEILEPPNEPPPEEENKNLLKIPIVDDGYKCPIEGCGKTYRRENLAQMHVKHYHPEYTKFLDSTPNVADLAYARTVGESLDRSPSTKIPSSKPPAKITIPKKLPAQSSQAEGGTSHPQSPSLNKDSEIIKLLNTKTVGEIKRDESIRPLPSGLPSSMYPDIKLKDLLNKSEAIPLHRDDLNLRALSTTRPPMGIKTLLPVRQADSVSTPGGSRSRPGVRRKRGYADSFETAPKGGQVIKIVRMKQEEIINCTCGYTEEDGLMIQCDLCLCWQHAFCNNIEQESQVPDKYICYICQNPAKQRMSMKYFHDQDWLKHGVLATAGFHTKDEEMLRQRFGKLKKSHDISGGLYELHDFVHTLKIKLKIAEAKNHPKLYLWSKQWDKLPLPEKLKEEPEDHDESKTDPNESSLLMMILKSGNNETKPNPPEENHQPIHVQGPIIPQPEAAIDSADCRLNLLDHIAHCQNLVEERLDYFEKQIDDLDDSTAYEQQENYPRTRQTISMLLKDLETLKELSTLTTL